MKNILCVILLLGAQSVLSDICVISAKSYYVSPEGCDLSGGTIDEPFETFERALSVLISGDTLFVRDGEYYETVDLKRSGSIDRPIVISNYPGEKVLIYGADQIKTRWECEGNNIWVTELPFDFTYIQQCQVFKDNRALVEARYPNMPDNADMSMIGEYGPVRAIAQSGTDKDGITLETTLGKDLAGAGICIWPGAYGVSAWGPSCRKIKEVRNNKIFFDKEMKSENWFGGMDPDTPHPGNPYFIFGHKELLDNENEYYIDEDQNKIFIISKSDPNMSDIKIKKRFYGIKSDGLSNIQIKGLTVIGATLSVMNADRVILEECRFLFPEYVRYPGSDSTQGKSMVFAGKNSIFRYNEIGYCSTNGLSISGSNLKIQNNYIHDIACTGIGAGIFIDNGTRYTLLNNNVIIRSGRSHFLCPGGSFGEGENRFNENFFKPTMIEEVVMEYNYLQDHNTYTSDCALFYAWNVDGQGTKFRFNYCIETLDEQGLYKYTNGTMDKQAQGLYSDNFCRNMEFYGNVVINPTTGIQVNNFCINIQYFNNVIVNPVKELVATFGYPETPGYMKQTRVYNNTFYTTDSTKNYYLGIHCDKGSFLCPDESRQLYVKKVSFDRGRSVTERYDLADNTLVYTHMGLERDTTFEISFDHHNPALRNVESKGNRLFTSFEYGTTAFIDSVSTLPSGKILKGYGCIHDSMPLELIAKLKRKSLF